LPNYVIRLLAALLLACSVPSGAQDSASEQQLYEQERWSELAQRLAGLSNRSADQEYKYGMALAQLQRWDRARDAFTRGSALKPRDKRFPIELAGVAFKQKNNSRAIAYLRRALRLDPRDDYANDFLASLYFLQNNLEAALKYWNRLNPPRPQIGKLRTEPPLHLRPAIVDHALAFSAASTLMLDQLRVTNARLANLDVLPTRRTDLLARSENRFDSVLRARELNGFGENKFEALLRTFSGIPFQEVTPEYYNLAGAATNITTLIRWDPDKRRYSAKLSGLLGRDPLWHYSLTGDLRNENWDIRNGFTGPAPILTSFNLRREVLAAEISRLVGWRWKGSLAAELSRRDLRNVAAGTILTSELLGHGYQLKQTAQINYEILRIPEYRFQVSSFALTQAARLFSRPEQSFFKLQASLEAKWFPRPRGDDFETSWCARAGRSFGSVPFDELFMLGLERDNDPELWMRAHIGTRSGRKGSAPLGGDYLIAKWETDKNLYSNGFLTLKLAPFLDTGKINDSDHALGSHKWLFDTGAEAKLRLLGIGVAFVYGKDLRTGNNAFYVTLAR
jgi:tetratricopeptide (TPR) repeat protein